MLVKFGNLTGQFIKRSKVAFHEPGDYTKRGENHCARNAQEHPTEPSRASV